MSREPRRGEWTTCTAVAPDPVSTVRACGDTSPLYGPGLVRISAYKAENLQVSVMRPSRNP